MKLLFALLMLTHFACTRQYKKESSRPEPPDHMVQTGNDRDEHGCIASAGYTWSVLKQNCIRVFESAIRLHPQDSSLPQTAAAFVLFNDNKTKAELYLPTQKKSLMLHRTGIEGNESWVNNEYELFIWKGYVLKQSGKTIYHGQ